MNFVDNTGHIFSLPSFLYNPIGYEYEEQRYIFWFEDSNQAFMSVNNYYIKPIYLYSEEKYVNIDINVESSLFSLISTKIVQNSLKEYGYVKFDTDVIKNSLVFNDSDESSLIELEVELSKDAGTGYMYPFYVVACGNEQGTWTSNIMIHMTCDDGKEIYTPITVGAEFIEDNEILRINARNLGINLPYDIIKSLYDTSFYNNEFIDNLYDEKIKEYLMNYMKIRGEIGNYSSAKNSLKWFGWNKRLTLVSLFETDNQFKSQFIRDYFDTNSDFLDSYKNFRNSTLLSLFVKENVETGEYDDYDLNADFIGENQPLLENLFNKYIKVEYESGYHGRDEESYYWKRYYDFSMSEIMLKLSALKYFYEKYFLPVHLAIHTASVEHKVYANDIKMLNRSNVCVSENIIANGINDYNDVIFPENKSLWLTEQIHYIDSDFNEWEYLYDNEDYYYVHDTCLNIPIKFNLNNNTEVCNVITILEKDTGIHDRHILSLNHLINIYDDNILIYDITKNIVDLNNLWVAYKYENESNYSIYYKGIKSLKNELIKKHTKKYDVTYENESYHISINDNDIILQDHEFVYEKDGVIYIIPSIANVHFDVFDKTSGECEVYSDQKMYLRFKYDNDRLHKVLLNDNDITSDINIDYTPTSVVLFEKHFSFNPKKYEYRDLVLYPKLFSEVNTNDMNNKHMLTDDYTNISNWIGGKFTLHLSLNGKWYKYEFTVKIPDIQLDFGTLNYKYYDDDLKFLTKFNQIKELNTSEKTIKFNSFMHEPQLTKINNIKFIENFVQYIKLTNAKYISGDMIPSESFYSYFDIIYQDPENSAKRKTYRVRIEETCVGQPVVIPKKALSAELIFYMFYDGVIYAMMENSSNEFMMVVGDNIDTISLNDPPQYFDTNDYKIFLYDKETNTYYTEIRDEIYRFVLKTSFNNSIDTFTSKYIEKHNIVKSDKYLNQIHVYDLYRLNDHVSENKILFHNDVDLRYHGIRFTHENYINGNKLIISGNYKDLTYEDNRINDMSLHKSLLPDDYSKFINTYDDLIIYSIYEGDKLITGQETEPDGYVYYEKVNGDGEIIDEYTNEIYNRITFYSFETFRYHTKNEFYDDVYYDLNNIKFNKLNELQQFFEQITNNTKIVHNDVIYDIIYNENDKCYYINDLKNIDGDNTKIRFKIVLLYNDVQVNPSCTYFNDNIKPLLENTNEFVHSNYSLMLSIESINYKLIRNIEHIYKNEYIIFENGEYHGNINGYDVILTPFYKHLDTNKDPLYHGDDVDVLNKQPGYDWHSINDDFDVVDDYIEFIDDLSVLDNMKEDPEQYEEDAVELTKWRKYLRLDITEKIKNDFSIYNDDILHYKITNKISEQIGDVEFLTIVKVTNNEETSYFNDRFDIDRNDIDEMMIEAFFVIKPMNNLNDEMFTLVVEPSINRYYKDYDKLEYDSFIYLNTDNENDIVKINIGDNEYIYSNKYSEEMFKLYDTFFKNESTRYMEGITINDVNVRKELSINTDNVEYDAYLMHDNDYWYLVYISKDTCDKTMTLYDFIKHPDFIEFVDDKYNEKYKFVHSSSSKKFLVNRYIYKSKNGLNHFNKTDLIAAKIINNNRMPIDINTSNKWEITPISYGIDKVENTTLSNTEMTILNIPKNNNVYERGIYDVIYRYNIDGNTTHQYKKNNIIRIS